MSGTIESRPASLRAILIIALPMVVSQASETINLFVDRLFLSRLGEAYLAGAMSGGLTAFTGFSLFAAAVGYVNAITAPVLRGAEISPLCPDRRTGHLCISYFGTFYAAFSAPGVPAVSGCGAYTESDYPGILLLPHPYFRFSSGITAECVHRFFPGPGAQRNSYAGEPCGYGYKYSRQLHTYFRLCRGFPPWGFRGPP